VDENGFPQRAAAWSLGIAIAVLALKIGAWYWTGSVALYSDALESIVNVAAAGAAFLALRYSARPADENHPFGHSKIEYFSAVLEAALIVVAALAIIGAAIPRFERPVAPDLTPLGIGLSIFASIVNATLAWFLVRAGHRHRSPALVADGHHVYTDVATSVGVLLGLGAAWFTGAWWLDPMIAILVAVNILWVGGQLLRRSFSGLMDEGLPEEDLETLRPALEESMGDAIEIHAMRSRRSGPTTFLEFDLVVPAQMTVEQAHAICDRLESTIAARMPGAIAVIHVEPEGEMAHGSFVVRRRERA
jgi:cation diffusion facilitator family transporter